VASPRAGSKWALPFVSKALPETDVLQTLTRRSAKVDEFFATHVYRHDNGDAPRGQVGLPMYAAVAGADALVNTFSAGFGIPRNQKFHLTAGHSDAVKPRADDDGLINWLLGDIVQKQLALRAQTSRIKNHTLEQSGFGHYAGVREVVTRFYTDSSGLAWEEIYNEVRQSATTATVTVNDSRHTRQSAALLLAVHDADRVVRQAEDVQLIVQEVCAEQAADSHLSVGIAPVGPAHPLARSVVEDWIGQAPGSPKAYVEGAADEEDLRYVLGRFIQVIVNRDPHRGRVDLASDAVLAVRDPYAWTDDGGF